MEPCLNYERVPEGMKFSVSFVLPGSASLDADGLRRVADGLADVAMVLRAHIAGEAMVSDVASGEILYIPDDTHDPMPGLLRKFGGDA